MEGNIWEALKRIKKRAIKDKKEDVIDSRPSSPEKPNNHLKDSDESSWKESEVESEESEEEKVDELPQDGDKPKTNKNFLRSSTYRLRKENTLNNLNKSSECELSVEGSESESDDPNNIKVEPLSANIEPNLEENKKNELQEKAALQLVKQLIQPGQVSVAESDVSKFHNKFLFDFLKVHERVRVTKIDDIILEEKQPEESKQNQEVVRLDILSTFVKNRKTTENKKGRSSVVQFLIENNLKKETLNKETIDLLDKKEKNRIRKHSTTREEVLDEAFSPLKKAKDEEDNRMTFQG